MSLARSLNNSIVRNRNITSDNKHELNHLSGLDSSSDLGLETSLDGSNRSSYGNGNGKIRELGHIRKYAEELRLTRSTRFASNEVKTVLLVEKRIGRFTRLTYDVFDYERTALIGN
jgi:hypothetical protein